MNPSRPQALRTRGTIFANFSWLMFDRIGRIGLNLIVGIAVARHLGPAEFGMLNFANALAAIFVALVGLGFEEILVRDLAASPSSGQIWRAARQLRIVAAVAAYVCALGVAVIWRPDAPRIWGVVALVAAGLLFTPADLVDLWFQAQGRMRPPAMARQLALWVAAGWRIVLLLLGAGLMAFAAAALIEGALVAVALLGIFSGESVNQATPGEVTVERWRLLHEGWPLMLSGVLVAVTMQSDRLIIGRFCGDAATGTYAVAVRLTEVFYVLPFALGAAVMPRFAILQRENPERYWRLARWAFFGLGLAGIALSTLLAAAATVVVPLVFGPRYEESTRLLAVYSWVLTFVFMVSLRSRLLVIEAGTRWVLWMSLLTALLDVGGNLLLIPRFGAVGAAYAAIVAWAFSALAAPWLFAETRRLNLSLLGRAPSQVRPLS